MFIPALMYEILYVWFIKGEKKIEDTRYRWLLYCNIMNKLKRYFVVAIDLFTSDIYWSEQIVIVIISIVTYFARKVNNVRNIERISIRISEVLFDRNIKCFVYIRSPMQAYKVSIQKEREVKLDHKRIRNFKYIISFRRHDKNKSSTVKKRGKRINSELWRASE